MPVVAANTYRVSITGTINSAQNWANVFHVQRLGATPPAVDEAAQFVQDAYAANFLPNMDAMVLCDGTAYVDLSSTSGDSGILPWTADPDGGALSGTSLTPNVAALIHWPATGNRQQRNGRTYLPGLPAAQVFETGLLATEWVAQLSAAATDFIADLQDADLALSVLSVSGDVGTPRAIGSGQCDGRVGTMRRRNRK
jgi:hypothetical protein